MSLIPQPRRLWEIEARVIDVNKGENSLTGIMTLFDTPLKEKAERDFLELVLNLDMTDNMEVIAINKVEIWG